MRLALVRLSFELQRTTNTSSREALPLAEDPHRRFLKVLRLRLEDVGRECLRIPVGQREPRALDLHHDAVPLPERVVDVGRFEPQRVGPHRLERDGLLEEENRPRAS